MKRIICLLAACLVISVTTLSPDDARAAEESAWVEGGLGIGSVASTFLWGTAKTVFAVGGTLTGGLAYQGGGLLPTFVLVALAPTAAALLQAALLRTRERLADREAARMTGDPRGLASALHRLNKYSRYLTGWLRRFRFIYTSESEGGARLLRTHPPTEERVRNLLSMESRVEEVPVRRPRVTYRLVG